VVADSGTPLTSAAACPDPAGALTRRAEGASTPGLGDFATFFHEHRDPVHRFLWRLTRNAADADDLVQETFLVAWRKRAQFDGRGSAEGWLRRTAYRVFLNQRAKTKRRADLDERRSPMTERTAPAVDGAVADREAAVFLLRRVEEALDELPDEPREAFVLFRFEGLTCAQIADATDTPVKTVETRLRRATELLAAKVRKYRESFPGR
jgi:RNA polymerase sigma-70 factor, ECF subfamily